MAQGLVAELVPPHAQSAWGFKGERVRVAGLAACCNYFSKKKKIIINNHEKECHILKLLLLLLLFQIKIVSNIKSIKIIII